MSSEHFSDQNGRTTSVAEIKPVLVSVNGACEYLGGISRAKLYADVLPQLETVSIGGRRLVIVASMDRLIEAAKAEGK